MESRKTNRSDNPNRNDKNDRNDRKDISEKQQLVDQVYSAIIVERNPVDICLVPRNPKYMGIFSKDHRDNVENAIKSLITTAIKSHPMSELKLLYAQEITEQQCDTYEEIHFFSSISDDNANTYKQEMGKLNQNFITTIDNDKLIEILRDELFESLANGHYDFLDKIFTDINLVEHVSKIVKTELHTLSMDHLHIIHQIFKLNNAFESLVRTFKQQQREQRGDKSSGSNDKEAKEASAANDSKTKTVLITKKDVDEKYEEIGACVRTEYKKLVAEQTIQIAPRPKAKKSGFQ
jgi:hypothetical protein